MRPMLKVTGGLAIVMIFFWGTLFIIGSPEYANNQLRAKHVRLLSDALEKYREARGGYPALPDNPVDDLKRELVGSKFLEAIPSDPAGSSTGRQYRYAGGGQAYGVLVTLEAEPSMAGLTGMKPALTCVAGVNIRGSGAWGDPPACPF